MLFKNRFPYDFLHVMSCGQETCRHQRVVGPEAEGLVVEPEGAQQDQHPLVASGHGRFALVRRNALLL